MAKELAKQYDPKGTEDRIYQEWCDKGYFHTQIDRSKKPFTIVMPPPNVTGQLHMGHAMDETWQDILTRYKRMQGYAALWVPGTDHASIATEAKVVAAMREEGLTKEMLGRDGFLERAWAWKNTYGSRIVSQLKKLGCSCDWQRERFTMDEGCSDAVKEVFVRLYDKGLIYRGNRMVNWCPHCNTSISDAEVEYEEKDGSFWHLLYPVKETGEMLELATTRPETMLGDTAVAINGEDPRYTHLHGCHVILPLLNKEIPIVCDEHADMEKGTGVVKITPAHDPNDFEVGKRHDPFFAYAIYERTRKGREKDGRNEIQTDHERHQRCAAGDLIHDPRVSDHIYGISEAVDRIRQKKPDVLPLRQKLSVLFLFHITPPQTEICILISDRVEICCRLVPLARAHNTAESPHAASISSGPPVFSMRPSLSHAARSHRAPAHRRSWVTVTMVLPVRVCRRFSAWSSVRSPSLSCPTVGSSNSSSSG